MKMVKHNGNMVPFFAADGKGSGDLKKAMYGMMVRRAQEGAMITDPPKNGDDKVISPRFSYVSTPQFGGAFQEDTEGMVKATSPDKIDAFNITLPESNMLEDLDEATKQTILGSNWANQNLTGEGNLDEQYNEYAARTRNAIEENPSEFLEAINAAIEDDHPSFESLKGKSDEEKISIATAYMTDKKIGAFHGAIRFNEEMVPDSLMFNPNVFEGAGYRFSVTEETQDKINSGQYSIDEIFDLVQNDSGTGKKNSLQMPLYVFGVGNKVVKGEDANRFIKEGIAAGVDMTDRNSTETKDFVNAFMEKNGSVSAEKTEFTDGEGGRGSFQIPKLTFENASNIVLDLAEGSLQSGNKKAAETREEFNKRKSIWLQGYKRAQEAGNLESYRKSHPEPVFGRRTMNEGGMLPTGMRVKKAREGAKITASNKDLADFFRRRKKNKHTQREKTFSPQVTDSEITDEFTKISSGSDFQRSKFNPMPGRTSYKDQFGNKIVVRDRGDKGKTVKPIFKRFGF